MAAPTYDITITKGKTFVQTLLYAEDALVYKEASALPALAPARITVAGHGLPTNWPVRIESAKAPSELNTPDGEWWLPRVIDADTLEFNALNLTRAKAFAGPAVLIYQQPTDLTGWKFRAQVRDKVGGTVLLDFSSDPADGATGLIDIDEANSNFTLTIDALTTALIPWNRAVYDIEAIKPDGTVVSVLAPSRVTVEEEITVWA